MQITKITDKQDLLLNPKKKYLSAEVLQREFDYYRAEKLLRKMWCGIKKVDSLFSRIS